MTTADTPSPAEDGSNAVELAAVEHDSLLNRDDGLLRAVLAGRITEGGDVNA